MQFITPFAMPRLTMYIVVLFCEDIMLSADKPLIVFSIHFRSTRVQESSTRVTGRQVVLRFKPLKNMDFYQPGVRCCSQRKVNLKRHVWCPKPHI